MRGPAIVSVKFKADTSELKKQVQDLGHTPIGVDVKSIRDLNAQINEQTGYIKRLRNSLKEYNKELLDAKKNGIKGSQLLEKDSDSNKTVAEVKKQHAEVRAEYDKAVNARRELNAELNKSLSQLGSDKAKILDANKIESQASEAGDKASKAFYRRFLDRLKVDDGEVEASAESLGFKIGEKIGSGIGKARTVAKDAIDYFKDYPEKVMSGEGLANKLKDTLTLEEVKPEVELELDTKDATDAFEEWDKAFTAWGREVIARTKPIGETLKNNVLEMNKLDPVPDDLLTNKERQIKKLGDVSDAMSARLERSLGRMKTIFGDVVDPEALVPSKAFRDSENAVKTYEKAIEKSKATIDSNQTRVDALRVSLVNLAEAQKTEQSQLNSANATYANAQKEMDKANHAVQGYIKRIKDLKGLTLGDAVTPVGNIDVTNYKSTAGAMKEILRSLQSAGKIKVDPTKLINLNDPKKDAKEVERILKRLPPVYTNIYTRMKQASEVQKNLVTAQKAQEGAAKQLETTQKDIKSSQSEIDKKQRDNARLTKLNLEAEKKITEEKKKQAQMKADGTHQTQAKADEEYVEVLKDIQKQEQVGALANRRFYEAQNDIDPNEQAKAYRTLAFSIRYMGTIGNKVLPGFSKMLTPISAGLRLAARGGDELKKSFAMLKPVLIEALSILGPVIAAIAAISLAIKVLIGLLKLLFGIMTKLVQLAYQEMLALTKVLGVLSKGFLKFVGLLGKGLVSGLGLAVKGFKGLVLGIHNFNMKLVDGVSKLFGFITGIHGVSGALNKLKSAVTEGLKNLVKVNGGINSTNQAMSLLYSSLTQLKNAWAAAFSPILEAIAPALNYLIQLLVKAVTVVGQFFSALTGKNTFIKAKKLNLDYAASLDKTSKKTKKAKEDTRELGKEIDKLGQYDELNVIGDEQDKSTDATTPDASGVSPDDMFETAEIPSKIKDWVDALKKAWANEDWDWFYDQGAQFARWLDGWVEKGIDFLRNKAQPFARKLGHALANLLNGVFADLDLAFDLGTLIGEAFNTILAAVGTFLNDFDFFQFGRFIGTGLMGAIKAVHWDELGEALADGINGIFDFIGGVATDWDVDVVAEAFDDLINSAITAINWEKNGQQLSYGLYKLLRTFAKAIHGIHWMELGIGLADFIKAINFESILTQLSNGIANLLNGITTMTTWFLKQRPFEGLAKGLGTALTNLFSGDNAINLKQIGANIAEIINQIFGMFGKFAESFKGGEVGEAIGRGINSMFENLDPSTAAKNVSDFIMDVLRTATGALREANLPKLGTKLGEFFADINWAEILDKVAVGIRMFLTDVAQFGINFIESGGLKNFATSLGNALNSIFGDTDMWSKVGELVGKSLSTLGDMVAGLVSGEEGNKLAEGLHAFFEGVTTNMDGAKLAEGISKLVGTALTELQEFLNSDDVKAVSDAFDSILKQALELIPWDDLSEALTTAIAEHLAPALLTLGTKLQAELLVVGADIVKGLLLGLKSKWDELPIWIKGVIIFLIDTVKMLFGIASPSTVFFDIGMNIVQGLIDGLNSLKESLLQWWEDIKTAIHEKVEALKEGVREKWEEMKARVEETMLALKTSIEEKWSAFKDKIIEVATTIKDTVVSKWEEFKSKLESIWTAMKSTVESVWNGIKSVITGVISTVGTAISTFVNNTITAINNIKSAIQGLGGMGLGGAIGGILNKAQSAAKNSGQSDDWARRHRFMPEAMTTMAMMSDLGLGRDIVTSPLQRFYENAIPLATGAVIPPNKEFAAILGDQKQGVNIESPLQTMIDAFNTALQQNGLAGGGGNQPPIVLQLNGKTIAQAVWDEEEKQYKQNIRR